ncbi:MAG: hypothetical protein ACR2N0_04425 [Rubrobacteraceae bacterium]
MSSRRESFRDLLSVGDGYGVCAWSVAPGYFGGKKKGEKVEPVHKEGSQCHVYHPLEVPDLFLEFARLGVKREPSKEKMLSWISKHGLLRRVEKKWPLWERPAKDAELIENQEPITLEDFREHAERARGLLDLYSEIQRGDVQRILNRVEEPHTSIDTCLWEQTGRNSEAWDFEKPLSKDEKDEIISVAASVLADEVNESITGVNLVANPASQSSTAEYRARRLRARMAGEVFDEERNIPPYDPLHRFKQGWSCPDLLSAIYFQFYLMITNNDPLRKCENPRCNIPFPPTRKDNRFCSPSCKSTMSYHRRKGLKQGS